MLLYFLLRFRSNIMQPIFQTSHGVGPNHDDFVLNNFKSDSPNQSRSDETVFFTPTHSRLKVSEWHTAYHHQKHIFHLFLRGFVTSEINYRIEENYFVIVWLHYPSITYLFSKKAQIIEVLWVGQAIHFVCMSTVLWIPAFITRTCSLSIMTWTCYHGKFYKNQEESAPVLYLFTNLLIEGAIYCFIALSEIIVCVLIVLLRKNSQKHEKIRKEHPT